MSEKPPQQPEKPKIFNVHEFVQKLSLLEVQLFEVIQKLEQAMRDKDENNIAIFMAKKTRLTNDMFAHLAHALKISNGNVRRLAQFNPNNTRYYMKLSLPCEPRFLWMGVEEWLADKEDDEVPIAKGKSIEEAINALLNPPQ
ncbi:hypothetical protein ACFL10_00100 [Patescibacteria group bacterium]